MFDYLQKPCPEGHQVTMVLDTGLGPAGLEDLLSVAAPFIQIVKFGWGTSGVVNPSVVRRKIELIRSYEIQVCPGGTFFEIAYLRKTVPRFLSDLAELGFSCVEVSDGTVDLPFATKLDLIRQACDRGFTVVSEIGRKTPEADGCLDVAERCREAAAELQAGSWKVILEARESGSLGIYDSAGKVRERFVEELAAGLDLSNVIFEAPRKEQQLWLIRRFGPSVHLGNVRPEDAIALETLRRGLRADTLLERMADG